MTRHDVMVAAALVRAVASILLAFALVTLFVKVASAADVCWLPTPRASEYWLVSRFVDPAKQGVETGIRMDGAAQAPGGVWRWTVPGGVDVFAPDVTSFVAASGGSVRGAPMQLAATSCTDPQRPGGLPACSFGDCSCDGKMSLPDVLVLLRAVMGPQALGACP